LWTWPGAFERAWYRGCLRILWLGSGVTNGGISITQADVGEVGEAGDHFGAAVVSGDFNGDKIDDLVVGAPGRRSVEAHIQGPSSFSSAHEVDSSRVSL
jgi:hypothetical protein